MNTTRIVFIVVCVILAVILVALGLIFRKNTPDGQYSITTMISNVGKKRKRRNANLSKFARGWMTIALAIFAMALFLIFSKR